MLISASRLHRVVAVIILIGRCSRVPFPLPCRVLGSLNRLIHLLMLTLCAGISSRSGHSSGSSRCLRRRLFASGGDNILLAHSLFSRRESHECVMRNHRSMRGVVSSSMPALLGLGLPRCVVVDGARNWQAERG